MKHYSIEQWADYLRGLLTGPDQEAMRHHLAQGCALCQGCVNDLGTVRSALTPVEIPAAWLERARAIFPARNTSPAIERLVAQLSFDSLGQPLPAGLRGSVPVSRRLAYSVEDVSIELLVDGGAKSRSTIVTGQVSVRSRMTPPRHVVELVSGHKTLRQAETSEWGEFQLEFAPRRGLRLVVRDQESRREIEVPLDLVSSARRPANRPDSRRSDSEAS